MARRNVTGLTELRAQKGPDIAAGARRMVIAGNHECDAWDRGERQNEAEQLKEYPSRGHVFVTGRVRQR
jgi:hypothetical protein